MSGFGKFALACALICSLVFAPCAAGAFFPGGLSLKDEKKMGRKFEVMMRSSAPVIDDPEISQYVAGLLARLTRAIPPQPFDFRSSVVLHPSLNAFAVPGGYVCVFTGLIMNLDNESELAGVLAHELAHVTQRHVAARLERARYLTLGSLLAAAAGIAIGGPAGAAAAMTAAGASQSALLKYSRLDESEADNIGLQYLTAAGYPANGMTGGFKILRRKSSLAGGGVPVYLSTHPAIGDRVNALQAKITAMPKARRAGNFDDRRFQRVKTLLWARYGDGQAALQRFSGRDGLSLMGRAIVLNRQNRVAEAQKTFDAALAAAPDEPLIMREAGIFHYRKGSLAEAERLLVQAMKKNPGDYMASFFYGRLLDDTGREKQSDSYFRDVLRRLPQDSEAHEAYARSLGKRGDQANAYIHLAYSAIYANNKKLAKKYLEQARKLAENSSAKNAFARLETVYKERKEIWEKS